MGGRFLEEVIDNRFVVQEAKPELKLPKKYKVIILNDDYTPMEFVVEVLISFFSLSHLKATEIMLEVHRKGRGICGVFTKDIAETKAAQVNAYSQSQEYPLLCEIESE